jgi:hypothetical protein
MKYYFVIIGFVVVLLIVSYITNTSKTVELVTPTPAPSPTVSKQEKYIEMMLDKCFNEDYAEVICKG